ncbi:MAG: HD domain-containing protein [bacterium]|nr:HD domain-containing protein [bacterium]
MVYTELTRKALKLAYAAHQGQYDVSGVPYVFHPLHLAEQMTDEQEVCVALLHDVLEDTELTLQRLEEEFPKEITQAVELLTHKKGTDYGEYLQRLMTNPLAYRVKVADVCHNSDESRLQGCVDITEERREHFRQKYKKAREILKI